MSTSLKLATIKEKVLKYEHTPYSRVLPLARHPLLQFIPIVGNLVVFIQTALVVRSLNRSVRIPLRERVETWVSVYILFIVGMVPVLGLALTIYCTHCSDHLSIALRHHHSKQSVDMEEGTSDAHATSLSLTMSHQEQEVADSAASIMSIRSKKSLKDMVKRQGSVLSKDNEKVETSGKPETKRKHSVFDRVSRMPWMDEVMATSPTDTYRTSLSTNLLFSEFRQARYADIHDLATRNSKLPNASLSLEDLPSYLLANSRLSGYSNDDIMLGFKNKRMTRSLLLHMDEDMKRAESAESPYGTYKVFTYLWAKDKANTRAKRHTFACQHWTKRSISTYTGVNDTPILIALDGKVYDVSEGRGFYGPGCAYNVFAGRDASRLLAKQEFDDGMTDAELDAPIDKLDDLTEEDREALDSYIGLFSVKYQCVGDLVEP
ncbi:Dihydrodipicolinate synthase [Coemansia sp. RSA 1199]|nr:Dihydrodipicolinate synthase [Coemansia sp. RSA 1199]